MDPKSNMPDIRPELNREPDKREKKGAGFFANLFGGGTTAAAGGGVSSLGSAAASGGLLATKTGLLAVLVVGTTVAGGVGMMGYRAFGGAETSGSSGSLSLFAPKPKDDAAAAPALQPAAQDGTSASLQFLAQGNAAAKAPEAGGSAPAPADSASAAAGTSGDSAAGSGSAAGYEAGHKAPQTRLAKKFGELSKGFGGSGGAAAGSAPTKSAADLQAEAAARAAAAGQASAFSRGRAASGAAAGSRGIGRARQQTAMRNAFDALKTGRGAQTSQAAGRTFDGSSAQNAGPGADGGSAIGMAAAGAGAAAAAKSVPNAAIDKKEFQPPPQPQSTDVTPYKNEIQQAQMALGLGVILLLIGKLLAKDKTWFTKAVKMALAAAVIALGIMVIALGSKISGGQYGQVAQGKILAAAGLGLIIAGGAVMMDASDGKPSVEEEIGNTSSAPNGSAASKEGMMMGVNPFVLLGGGLATMGLIGTMMVSPKKVPASEFQTGSVQAVERYRV